MGTFSERLQAAEKDAQEPAEVGGAADAPMSPFSQDYRTEPYTLTAETTDQMLGLLVVVTNLV